MHGERRVRRDVRIWVCGGGHAKGEAEHSGRTEMSVVLKDSATN